MQMNKWISTLVLSMSGLLATSAMAAPQDPHSKHYVHQNQAELHQPKHEMDKKLDPSRDWRIGHTLPRQYQSSRYQVDYRSHKHLAQPKRGQQWYQLNGHYVLVSQHDHKILKML
ncbi:RcnB family protein [Acinetobacter ursingii]|uniref:RcnB family protein n=1 Tax=Acinetobacter ursingii TaxID=108980 RepID=UPI00124EA2D7